MFDILDEAEPGPCINIDEDIPTEIVFSPDELYNFLQKDPDVVLTFIGGEPTLRPEVITEVINNSPVKRFMMQTNGQLLHRMAPEIINRFETILISIDGDETLTDSSRGSGVYRRVMDNISHILANGYTGELIARMTVHERTDIFNAVTYLADNKEYPFSSIHWQMDANFGSDFRIRKFKEWSEYSYIPGIQRLAKEWLKRIEDTGIVPLWYPFIDPIEDMLYHRTSKLRCGSGYANYTIFPDGNISPCPIMVGMSDYYVGNVRNADPLNLKEIPVPGKCATCDILDFCGGRCLYSAIMKPWPESGADLVCNTVREHKLALEMILPYILKLIDEKSITLSSFAHEKYNGCEIIP